MESAKRAAEKTPVSQHQRPLVSLSPPSARRRWRRCAAAISAAAPRCASAVRSSKPCAKTAGANCGLPASISVTATGAMSPTAMADWSAMAVEASAAGANRVGSHATTGGTMATPGPSAGEFALPFPWSGWVGSRVAGAFERTRDGEDRAALIGALFDRALQSEFSLVVRTFQRSEASRPHRHVVDRLAKLRPSSRSAHAAASSIAST